MTAAIYLRVSTDKQTVENQRADCERICEARGYQISEVYTETGSAAKTRPIFDQLKLAAHQGKFNVLVVWAIDRFGRSLSGIVEDITALNNSGVQVVAVKESWLDTTGPARPILLGVIAGFAQFERERLIERTKAGMRRAKEEGKAIGRPRIRISPEKLQTAKDLRARKLPWREVAQAVHINSRTIRRALA